jgi:hypothetical protein
MNTRHRITLLGGAVLAAVSLSAGLSAPTASAIPGQCWNSPFGGFCDTAPQADGSYQNCITYGSSSFCQQVCHNPVTNQAVPTDYNFTTPC